MRKLINIMHYTNRLQKKTTIISTDAEKLCDKDHNVHRL